MTATYPYKGIKVKGKKIDEHRHIMQEHLGRKLGRYEVIHHINGNTRDNRIENLELTSLHQHSREHMKKEQRAKSKFSENDIKIIKRLLLPHYNCTFIGKLYDRHREVIGNIKRGKTWSDIK